MISRQGNAKSSDDIVGNSANPAFYTRYDVTLRTLAFRVRLGARDSGTDAAPTYSKVTFVGLDVNQDGAIDLFVGVDNQGNPKGIKIWNSDPNKLNTGPSNTGVVNPYVYMEAPTATNYDYSAVVATLDPTATSYDLDNDGATDYFLSFSMSFDQIVVALAARGITHFDENTPLSYILATSTQNNALNQDLNGTNGGINSSSTWTQLGGISTASSASGKAVPEPAALALLAMGTLVLIQRRWPGAR